MILRFLHLPCFGPVRNAAVVFHQNDLLPRHGAINFVVGVNGTGKSSLLRAVFVALHSLDHALESSEPLPFAFTLAYDARHRPPARTVMLWHPGGAVRRARLVLFDRVLPPETDWPALARECSREALDPDTQIIPGDRFVGSGDLREHLPRQVLAYTSGDLEPWHQAVERFYDPEDIEQLNPDVPEERPRRWSLERELALPDATETESKEAPRRKRIDPLIPTALPRCLLLRPGETKLAALALVIWHTAAELKSVQTDDDLATLRADLLEARDSRRALTGGRRLLQEADWFRATHLSLTLRREAFARDDLKCLLWNLYALADEVVQLPLGNQQAVISLGRQSGAGNIGDLARHDFPETVPPLVSAHVGRVEGAATGAEAVLRLFSPEGRLWELFERLLLWQRAGLLEDTTVTVQRLSRIRGHDGELDDVVIPYDSLSDGEQMLLGRMALLFLMHGLDGGLLLLDEPETHFNDVWKREIVDLVDDNVLKGTNAQVLVATHTSIALTDVFNEEVTLLKRDAASAQILALPLAARSFGASPVEIMREVFGAADSVGQRAREFMEMVLAVVGRPEEVAAVWKELDSPRVRDLRVLWHLAIHVVEALHLSGGDTEAMRDQVLHLLRELRRMALAEQGDGREPQLAAAVEALENRLGAGFYQFELRRRLRALRGPGSPEPTRLDPLKRKLSSKGLIIPPEEPPAGLAAGGSV